MINLLSKKEYILATFFITDEEQLRRLKINWSLRDKAHKAKIKDKEGLLDTEQEKFGGKIFLIDPDSDEKQILLELDLHLAFGLCVDRKAGNLYVAGASNVYKIHNGETKILCHDKLFNDLHFLSISDKGNLLINSTGTDSLFLRNKLDPNTNIWTWFATENGYDKDRSGHTRVIDKNTNYSLLKTATTEHTTHVNSAIEFDDEFVLATLFHQGELVKISRRTGKAETIIRNLKNPHAIRKIESGFMLSDTNNNRILFLDRNLAISSELANNFNWLQDSIQLSDGRIVAADSNNDRLIIYDKGHKKMREISWKNNPKKIACLEKVTEEDVINIFGKVDFL